MTKYAFFLIKPQASHAGVEALVRSLTGRGWVTVQGLEAMTGMDERRLAAAALDSDGEVIAGVDGCKLTRVSTSAEVRLCVCRMQDRATKLNAQASAILRVAEHYAAKPF